MFPLSSKRTVLDDAAREDCRLRVFAARLDTALKRAQLSSRQVARALGVHETDVRFWRAGITAPVRDQYRRLAALLNVPDTWLQHGAV